MSSCRHMAGGRCGSNRSISNSRCGSNCSISRRRDCNRISSSYYSLTITFIMHLPNVGSGGHLIVVLTLLGGTKRNRHPRPTLRWAACTSASGAEDSGIWPGSVPLHSGSKVHAIAVVSMATATTTASPTSTIHTPMLTSLAIQLASAGQPGGQGKYAMAPAVTTAAAHSERHYAMATAATPAAASTAAASAATHQLRQ